MKQDYVELVHDGLNEMMKEIKEIQEWQTKEENQDKDIQEHENYREPLSIDTEIVKRILLSWGGPEDGFKLYFSEDKELLRGVYYRADWGEYKETPLSEEESQLVYDFYMGGECL